MKKIFGHKNRKDFANEVFRVISSIPEGWLRLNKHLTRTASDIKYSVIKYNLNGVMVVSNKILSANDLMSGDNIRFFIEPFYSNVQTNA